MSDIIEALKDSLRFPFKSWKIILLFSFVLFFVSFIHKLPCDNDLEKYVLILLGDLIFLIAVGYGSVIVFNGINGGDNLPPLGDKKLLLWEGFKKFTVISLYSMILGLFLQYARYFFHKGNFLFTVFFLILLAFVYLTLIGALLNRYEHRGKFFTAFYFREIYRLIGKIGFTDMISIAICALIAQSLAVSCFIDLHPSQFLPIELFLTVFTFLLAPISLISTKRLVSLNLRRIYSGD